MTYSQLTQEIHSDNKKVYKKNKHRIGSVLFSVCLCFCFLLFSGFVFQPIYNITAPAVTEIIPENVYYLLFNMVLYVFCITVPFLIPVIACKTDIKKVLALYPRLTKNPFGYTVFVFGICLLFNLAMSILFPWYREVFVVEQDAYTTNSEIFLYFIQVAVLPAIFEEIIFRGVFITALRPMGTRFAVVLSAMLFGLAHFDPMQSMFAFLFGLLIGCGYVATGSLWPGIIVHFLNNSFSVFSACGHDIIVVFLGLMLYPVMGYAIFYLVRYFKMPGKYPVFLKEERESMLTGGSFTPLRAVVTNFWTYIIAILYVVAVLMMYLPTWIGGGTSV